MRRVLMSVLLAASACTTGGDAVVVGAVYPTGGAQGPGGLEEYRGVALAAELVNERGGVDGRPIRLELAPADSADAAPGAVERLVDGGATVIVGSYGSTISLPAASAASRTGAVFWETGAVGELDMGPAAGRRVFRFSPSGEVLGRRAVSFVTGQLLPLLDRPAARLRYSVARVDDVYGRAVGLGAMAAIEEQGLHLAGSFTYDPRSVDVEALAERIRRADTDVLVVVAYLDDGVALRRALVRAGVPLVANIGTSSSYCHPEFGAALGEDAVGVFASDKPDAASVDPALLEPRAAEALRWARSEYRDRFGVEMSAAGLAGFSGGWALFNHVLPRAESPDPDDVAGAIRTTHLGAGSLPNGGGLEFAPPGDPEAGANLRAATVIWEWVSPGTRAIVWPPPLAGSDIVPLIPT